MYAVIETGGKQHKVEEGQTLLIDLLSHSVFNHHLISNLLSPCHIAKR